MSMMTKIKSSLNLRDSFLARKKGELLFTFYFLIAILLFPWLAFLLVRFLATVAQIAPNSFTGHLISAFPNFIIAGLAISFLVIDSWDFSAIGFSWRKLIPALVFIILVLSGLYTILPLGMALFYEPRTLVVSFQGFSPLYLALFIRAWLIVGLSEEIAARGYLLNKCYSLFPKNVHPNWKKLWSVLFTLLFFSLVNYIRLRTAGNMSVSSGTLLTYFIYGLAVSYMYLRTNNLFVAGFMQAAFIFPPFGLTVGRVFALGDPGFIITFSTFMLFVILLTESYSTWGKILEFNPSAETMTERVDADSDEKTSASD